MVQGASQSAGRWSEEVRMYKAPPPEVSSEQFYETDASRGFARGFSVQTVSPLPIGWAEHVLAEGHWGRALREYMRDYNHWATIGVLNELLPQPDNRVTLAEEADPYGIPVARFDYTLCDNDKANMAYSSNVTQRHPVCGERPGRADHSAFRPPDRRRPDGDQPAELGGRLRPPSVGSAQPVPHRWLGLPDARLGQSGADDHGAGVAARRTDGERPHRRRRGEAVEGRGS